MDYYNAPLAKNDFEATDRWLEKLSDAEVDILIWDRAIQSEQEIQDRLTSYLLEGGSQASKAKRLLELTKEDLKREYDKLPTHRAVEWEKELEAIAQKHGLSGRHSIKETLDSLKGSE